MVPDVAIDGHISHMTKVNATGVEAYEVWSTVPVNPGGGICPCPNGVETPIYQANMVNEPPQGGPRQGKKLRYHTYDLATGQIDGPFFPTSDSVVRPMPSDYTNAAISLVARVDYGVREALFSGSSDQRICNTPDTWNPWGGSGVLFSRIEPSGTNYEETQWYWFLNILLPNWTCAAGVQTCYAPSPAHYAFTGAYPVIKGNTVFFYVQVWGVDNIF